jgi:hypothetical protein
MKFDTTLGALGIASMFGIDLAQAPDRTSYFLRKPPPPRYANDCAHRKAVDGRRANIKRRQRERMKGRYVR